MGNVAYYDQSIPFQNIRINSGMVIFRLDKARIDPLFLYIFSRSRLFAEQVRGLTTGSAQPQLPIRDIRRISLPLPDMDSQKAIALIIGALDDKIELNSRMNATLEAAARALFKSWFVDFDPVKAKMTGNAPFGMDAATAALFPARLTESELGDIPDGWTAPKFSSLSEVIGGGTPKTGNSEYWNGDIPWFSIADAPSHSDVFVLKTEKTITQKGIDESSTKIMQPGVTIITARGTVGRLALVGQPIPCSFISRDNSSITRTDRIDPATSIARHSRVYSSTTVRHFNVWPLAQES